MEQPSFGKIRKLGGDEDQPLETVEEIDEIKPLLEKQMPREGTGVEGVDPLATSTNLDTDVQVKLSNKSKTKRPRLRLRNQDHEVFLGEPCDGCGRTMKEGSIICVNCGYNSKTGKKAPEQHLHKRVKWQGSRNTWMLLGLLTLVLGGPLIVLYSSLTPYFQDGQEKVLHALCERQLKQISSHYAIKNKGALQEVVTCPKLGEEYSVYDVENGEENTVRFNCPEHRMSLWRSGTLDNDVDPPEADRIEIEAGALRRGKLAVLDFENLTNSTKLIGCGAVLLFSGLLGFIIIPFRESAGWGLAVLFVPFAFLAFWMKNFKDNIPAFLVSALGAVLIVYGFYLG
ncbi:MAG: hypothetical protein HRT88_15210 [Lentisphaeraceae bacterium]|nr:hypothetical protein [Lentisphaeraceae bacterium]